MEEKTFEPSLEGIANKVYDAIVCFHSTNTDRSAKILATIGLLKPHIREPSDGQMADSAWVTGGGKSVSVRCKEAHDEAVKLLKIGRYIMPENHLEFRRWGQEVAEFIDKTNPFLEVKITDKEEDKKEKPVLLTFNLKAAQEGAKVVTRDGNPVKIVADNIDDTNSPILYVGIKDNGKSFYNKVSMSGAISPNTDSHNDLFILKEAETVTIQLIRGSSGFIFARGGDGRIRFADLLEDEELIKTITVTI